MNGLRLAGELLAKEKQLTDQPINYGGLLVRAVRHTACGEPLGVIEAHHGNLRRRP